MGGSSSQQTQQNSTTNPWAPAQGTLTGILSQLNGYLPQTGITGTQNNALSTIENNANSTSQFNPAINSSTASLLAGGGALSQAPMLQAAYKQYGTNLAPIANNTNYDPMQTPGIGTQLQAVNDAVKQQVNGSFAAAGRDGSAYNQRALATGLAQGEAPIITNQYNQNVQNQQAASGNLYNAGNATGGLLAGLQQNYNTNQQAGVNQVGTGLTTQNAGAAATLQAEAARLGIPLQNLGLLANIGIPIAGLGGQSTGTSNTQNQASGAQTFATDAAGVANIGKFLFG